MIEHILSAAVAKAGAVFSGVGGALATSALLVAALMTMEIALVGWRRSSLRRLTTGGASITLDMLCALLVLSNLALLIGTVLSFGLVYLLVQTLKVHFGLNMLDHAGHPVLAYGLYILALDFSNYWMHRWMHHSNRLWQIHRFHHGATEMTMLTALRDHPLERALLHGVNAIPTALLGIPPVHYVGAQLAMQGLGYLKHSNLLSDWGPLGRWVIQSPAAHRVHHSTEPQDHNCNFASIFQFWDVLFGTARLPRRGQEIPIGVDGEPNPSNPLRALWRTTKTFYATLLPRH